MNRAREDLFFYVIPSYSSKLKITVDVKPNSNSDSIKQVGEFHYLVTLKAPARKGKANMALLKLLKKYFKKDVRLIRGISSRKKLFILEE